MTAKLKSAVAGALLATCLLTQNGDAGQVGPITTFVSGTTAKAADVNGNFSAVVTAVNDNATHIAALQTAPNVSGNLTLVEPSTVTAGNIMKGTASFIHDYGTRNTFLGIAAGNFTTQGSDNTAVGWNALTSNQGNGTENPGPGNNNAALGSGALQFNTTGSANTASGSNALHSNTTGKFNTAAGQYAMSNNTTGIGNAASGNQALQNNTTGSENTASGDNALVNNTTGSNNVAVGSFAGSNVTTGSWNIHINTSGGAGDDHVLRIGNGDSTGPQKDYIVGIRGVATDLQDGVAVYVSSGHQLGTASSSRRVKDHIADMGEASSALMRLRPVTFYYKADRNPKGRTLQYGLVAEEVDEIVPGLVAHSADGKAEAIYSQFLAPMLLNEAQKQQREIKRQAARLAKQETQIAALRRDAERMAGLLEQLKAEGMLTASREQ